MQESFMFQPRLSLDEGVFKCSIPFPHSFPCSFSPACVPLPRAYCSSVRPVMARPCWPRQSPKSPTPLFSTSASHHSPPNMYVPVSRFLSLPFSSPKLQCFPFDRGSLIEDEVLILCYCLLKMSVSYRLRTSSVLFVSLCRKFLDHAKR